MASQFWKATTAPGEVRRLRQAVADYATQHGITAAKIDDLKLAVSEVVTNAVIHAYPDGHAGDEGSITVMATLAADELIIRVVDDGRGFTPRMDSPGAGLGLAIAGRLAERIVVEHPARGGTEVRMTFAATA